MANELINKLSKQLEQIADSLSIPDYRYEQAEVRYKAIGSWLSRNASTVYRHNPKIYAQGSFRLGTVIKPISGHEEYDLDIVCELNLTKQQITQKDLKKIVGQEIQDYASSNNIDAPVEEGKRCWTIEYSDEAQFHVDILPSIPNGIAFGRMLEKRGFKNEWSDKAIAITDKDHPNFDKLSLDWLPSNPKGYAEWFKEQMKTQFEARRIALAQAKRASIEKIPEYTIQTPLQQVVKILKRHRDVMFEKHSDNKPISIIITTLAAQAYSNESNLLDALVNIVRGMSGFIIEKDGEISIANPVNPTENFADKWPDKPILRENFYRWYRQIQRDVSAILETGQIETFVKSLKATSSSSDRISVIGESRKLARFNVGHKEIPPWPMLNSGRVDLSAKINIDGEWFDFKQTDILRKGSKLYFAAQTNALPPYHVYWQVVNTGSEAANNHDLRGTIFSSESVGMAGLVQKESTAYAGTHWIECFIVKDGICVARSREFVVNIR